MHAGRRAAVLCDRGRQPHKVMGRSRDVRHDDSGHGASTGHHAIRFIVVELMDYVLSST
jgi:hypothetical protein